jgi:hypothetical protein
MIKIIQPLNWRIIKQAALTTVGLRPKLKVSREWKKKAILSEHSMLYFSDMIIAADMQYKTAIHLKTHNKTAGFYMLIQSQRPDWTDKPRNPEAIVKTIIKVNPKALIEISRVRLCNKAAMHTQTAWASIIQHISLTEPELVLLCVPKCVQQGYCSEKFKPCGFEKTDTFNRLRAKFLHYVKGY